MKKQYWIKVSFFLIISTLSSLIHAGQLQSSTPTLEEIREASFSQVERTPIRLSNGSWEGEPYIEGAVARPRVGMLKDIYLTGDLNRDGAQEAVVILWQSSGGTGSNSYVAVMSRQGNDVVNIGTALIGDRVKLRSAAVVDHVVMIDVLQAGDEDPMCCPRQLATRRWSLMSGQLEEGEIEVTGKLSLAVLDDSEWLLTEFENGKHVSEDIEITLAFIDGRVAGKSACNRYSAGIAEGDSPGRIKIGQSMGTLMACPDEVMAVERRYLQALSQLTDFSFHAGSLVLNGQEKGGAPFRLFFSRVEAERP